MIDGNGKQLLGMVNLNNVEDFGHVDRSIPRDDKALDIAGNASPEDNVVRIDK